MLAYVFGSHARGEAGPLSDVDVAVLAPRSLDVCALAGMQERLVEALGQAVDLVDLRAAPPLLAAEVTREGVPVIVRDPEAKFDFELDAIRRWEDTRPLRRVQQQLLRERARLGRSA